MLRGRTRRPGQSGEIEYKEYVGARKDRFEHCLALNPNLTLSHGRLVEGYFKKKTFHFIWKTYPFFSIKVILFSSSLPLLFLFPPSICGVFLLFYGAFASLRDCVFLLILYGFHLSYIFLILYHLTLD